MWKAARLAGQLPLDGAVGRATGGEGFTTADHLLLGVLDHLAVANWQRANAGAKRSQQSPFPKPVRRPGDKAQQEVPKTITAAKLLAHKLRHAK